MNLFRCLFLTGIVALPLTLLAQTNPIPNAGFESWSSGNPDMWITTNSPGFAVPVTQVSAAHSGSSAMQGSVLTIASTPWPPLVQAWFPVTASYGSLTGWYKYAPVGSDSLIISVVAWKQGMIIGGGSLETSVSVSSFSQFSVPIAYSSSGSADSMWILVSIVSSGDLHPGSTYVIDDLAFGSPTGIEARGTVPEEFSLGQNYPNPFNPSTTISFDVPELSSVRITILNVLGQTVGELVHGMVGPGHSSRTWQATVPSGVYFYRMEARSAEDPSRTFSQVRRMVLLR